MKVTINSIITKIVSTLRNVIIQSSPKKLIVGSKPIKVAVNGGRGPAGDGVVITKTSELINDGESGSPFVTHEDLPSNITLFSTNVNADVSGYFKLASTLDHPDYNDVAVDINTGAITGTNQLIASLVADAGLFVGNPGIINITTIGEIKRISGSGRALFYFELYKRSSLGVETLITTSNSTTEIQNIVYEQFSATALLNNGSFLNTDRLVLKFYGSKIAGGSDPSFNFLFGGTNPVRTLMPVPLSVVPASSTLKLYEGYISQSGGNAPTTLVLTDTLGLNTIVWQYAGNGTYFSFSNVYNPLKTSFFIDRPSSSFDETNISLISPDILQITTKRNYLQFQGGFITNGLIDNILSNTLIRIAIYD